MATSTDTVTSILSALKLNQLVAMIMMAVVTILDIAFVAVKVLSGSTVQSQVYPVIVGIAMTALTLMVYYWSTVVASGSYVSASASLMQVSMTGGQGSYPQIGGITPSGISGTNLTANDLAAVQALIAAGKVNSSILTSLSTMTPAQIQAVLQALGVKAA